jgi:calcium binding protein 39
VMTKYISDEENLKLMMRMLRDKSKSIQFEAFHVFKVFVANPNKAEPILQILIKNKEKLVSFLNNFHNDKGGLILSSLSSFFFCSNVVFFRL